MSDLWTPTGQSYQELSKEHESQLMNMLDFYGPVQDKWNPELRKIDPLLRLARAKERAFAHGIIAGFYHLVRINPGSPMWVQPIHDGHYGFVEPSLRMLDRLRESDLQNPQVRRARERAQWDREQREEKQREVDSERRIETMMDSWKARTQVRIPFHTETKWSQNVAGKRGRSVN